MATVVASIALGLAVLLDVVATVLLVRSDTVTPPQRVLQLIFTWAVPFIGSIIVIAIQKETAFVSSGSFQSGSSADVWLPGIGPRSETHRGDHGGHGGDIGHGGDAGIGGH